jgi:hypothetical protein
MYATLDKYFDASHDSVLFPLSKFRHEIIKLTKEIALLSQRVLQDLTDASKRMTHRVHRT